VLRRRLILLVPLLVLFAFVTTGVERAEGADVAPLVEGESFDIKPSGTKVVTDPTFYAPPNSQALKFTNNTAIAEETVTFDSQGDVVLWARGGQPNGSPTLRVKVDNGEFSPYQTITNNKTPIAYTFDLNVSPGSHTIKVNAGNTGTERYPFVDFVTFPASGSGGTDPGGDRDADTIPDTEDNCPDLYNKGQTDDDGDGVGNKCDNGFTILTDTDSDGVPDSSDNCPNVFNPNQNDGDSDGVGNACDDGSTTPPPPSDWPSSDCETDIKSDDDIDAIINSDPSGTATTFCVYAGTYQVSTQATLKAGDKLKGQPGTTTTVGPATKPAPVVELVGSGPDNLLRADGNGISISWVDLSGADGTGNGTGAIAAGSAGTDFLVEFARIHENASLGISNMKGTVLDSEFFSNSEAESSLGFNGSAVKGITEYEAGRVYVHDEQGNGLWCDVGCSNDPDRENGFWVHDSVVVDSGRAGIRYENSASEALFENNEIQGNGRTEHRGGVDIRDSQNAQVVNNNFGNSGNGIGVRATDSGRSDRVNLSSVDVVNNDMNGDRIVTCGGPVVCSGNTEVGSR
jgi:hypothetical protein